MKVKRVTKDAEIEFSYEEMLVLSAALNEVCNGIDVFEFETRIGVEKAKVEILMSEIQAVFDQIEKK